MRYDVLSLATLLVAITVFQVHVQDLLPLYGWRQGQKGNITNVLWCRSSNYSNDLIYELNFRWLACWIKCNYMQGTLYRKRMKLASLYLFLQQEVTFFIHAMWLRYLLWKIFYHLTEDHLCLSVYVLSSPCSFSQGCGNCLWLQWNPKNRTSIPEATVIESVQWSYSSGGRNYTI